MSRSPSETAVGLALQGRWAEAESVNRRIVELAPADVRARNRLARALEALGRPAEARDAYSAALGLDAHDPVASRGLARLAGATPAATQAAGCPVPSALDYGRLEPRVEEPPELQEGYLEAYEEYDTEEPERAVAERVELAGELAEEARLEELEGVPGADLLEDEAEQLERDRALAAEEESDRR